MIALTVGGDTGAVLQGEASPGGCPLGGVWEVGIALIVLTV